MGNNIAENNMQSIHLDLQNPLYGEPIEVIGLSSRAYNVLRRSNIRTVAELCGLTKTMLSSIRKLGVISLVEIIDKLAEHGLSLSPEDSGAERPWHNFQPYAVPSEREIKQGENSN